MARSRYKLWSEGNALPLGGATGALNIGMAGIAKKATAAFPHVIINEIICNRIAQILLLPCPPGALMEKGSELYFFCLDFNISGMSLPPVIPSDVISVSPILAWKIILFDILIMNADRHDQNIAHDTTSNAIQIFDHSHAFTSASGDIEANLARKSPALSIGEHCLAKEITVTDGFENACNVVKAIPDFFIEGVVEEACEVGLPKLHARLCIDILRTRRDGLRSLVRENAGAFPKLAVAIT